MVEYRKDGGMGQWKGSRRYLVLSPPGRFDWHEDALTNDLLTQSGGFGLSARILDCNGQMGFRKDMLEGKLTKITCVRCLS